MSKKTPACLVLLALLVLTAVEPLSAAQLLGALPQHIWIVQSGEYSRVIVLRKCGKDQCHTTTYIQRVDRVWRDDERSEYFVLREYEVMPVEEANSPEAQVTNVMWRGEMEADRYQLELTRDDASASSTEVHIVFQKSGKFEVHKR